MNAEGKFIVYCLEIYKSAKNMTGRQVIELFKRYGVTQYLLSSYEALHTTGTDYIIEEIDLFIKAQQTDA